MRATPVLSFLIVLAGCPAHTRKYEPVSPAEQRALERANLDVFPDDVRKALRDHYGTVVAWPGVVVSSDPVEDGGRLDVDFVLEHHYYDWLEDFGAQREKIFLSPRGEGRFRTSWSMRDTQAVRRVMRPGTLLLVYGHPDGIASDGTLYVKATYIRAIESQWYRTDKLDYGRPGQPVTILKER